MDEHGHEHGHEDGFIRPFVITGGRTQAHRIDLRLETLLSVVPDRRPRQLGFEHRAVVALCARPTSIAELASALDLPVGVITVVVDDLHEEQQVTIHQPRPGTVSVALLERLLDGVRAL